MSRTDPARTRTIRHDIRARTSPYGSGGLDLDEVRSFIAGSLTT
jgi:hypothetical protein